MKSTNNKFLGLIKLTRPKHWLKNLIIFAPLIFSGNLLTQSDWLPVIYTFLSFCFISSSIYCLNDIIDCEKDLLHPIKKNRPLPSKCVQKNEAFLLSITLALAAFLFSMLANLNITLTIFLYLCLNIFYSVKGKRIVIFDVILISIGFVLRIFAGSNAIGIEPSGWILITTFFATLLLALSKRRNELCALGEQCHNFRQTLGEYNTSLLDQLIISSATITIISYSLYTLDAKVIKQFNTTMLPYTIPFVVFGIFNYLKTIYATNETDPVAMINKPATILSILLWTLSVILIIYFH